MNTAKPFARQPMLWWALVLMLALLSYYVHVLHAHVERGAQWRESFGARTAPPPQRVAADTRKRPRQPAGVTRTAQR